MAITVTVTRGHTFVANTPFTTDDLNSAALPSVSLSGGVATADLAAGSVTAAKVTPGAIAYIATGGSANAYTATLSPALASLTAGAWFFAKASFTNTGAATINVNGLGAVAIKKWKDQALAAGDIVSGQCILLEYDGTNWQLLSEPGSPRPVYGTTAGSSNAYTLTLSGWTAAANSDLAGVVISFKASFANTAACTLNVNGLGAVSIKKPDGTDPASGDIGNGRVVAVVYDGTNFAMIGQGSGSATLPDVVAAGTSASPSSITIDAKGRITSITAGTPLSSYTSSDAAVPAAGAAYEETHGLGAVPKLVQWVFVCNTTDAGYASGDELNLNAIYYSAAERDRFFTQYRTATKLGLQRNTDMSTLKAAHKSTGAETTLTEGNWRVKVYAFK